MSATIQTTNPFERRFKKLSKKYLHLPKDLESLIALLAQSPQSGGPIPEFNKKVWKIRMASTDMKKGKSGGFRIIYYYFQDEGENLYLLDIYAKNEQENIAKNEIVEHLQEIGLW